MVIEDNTPAADACIETDICVIGAGPAGIALAREFLDSPVQVTLLESGTFEFDEEIQDLGEGDVDAYYLDPGALAGGRRRQFGGTTNLWTYATEPPDGRMYARSLPPEARDLSPRADRPDLGWPVSIDDLKPFYQRAQSVWNGGVFDYDVATWSDGLAPIETTDGLLATRIVQHGPADVFATRYREDLVAAPNVAVRVGCTAIAFESNLTGERTQKLRVARRDGSAFSVVAKAFVLACGGVENTQLLLLSDATKPGAIGNRYDNVGRYVTNHPEFRMGTIVPSNGAVFDDIALYDLRWHDGFMVSACLTIADEVKRAENLLNMSVALTPRGAGFGTPAHRAMTSLTTAARRRERPTHLAADLGAILRSPRQTATALLHRNAGQYSENRGGWSRAEVDPAQFEAIEVWAAPEQTADVANKYTLTDRRDWLGRRRVKLEWNWSRSDRENTERSIHLVSSYLERAGLGTFQRWVELDGPARPPQSGLHHPMGGTRMHVNPQFGVVDENCRVHGLDNVYVAGSSVFPTGLGYANPTLTLLALTLRLADHVKAEVGQLSSG